MTHIARSYKKKPEDVHLKPVSSTNLDAVAPWRVQQSGCSRALVKFGHTRKQILACALFLEDTTGFEFGLSL